ncbi:MAG: hypothetical protein LBD71_02975, partial [Treponema sp.]|nr:hypothetical protein [Treponema sp.]
ITQKIGLKPFEAYKPEKGVDHTVVYTVNPAEKNRHQKHGKRYGYKQGGSEKTPVFYALFNTKGRKKCNRRNKQHIYQKKSKIMGYYFIKHFIGKNIKVVSEKNPFYS